MLKGRRGRPLVRRSLPFSGSSFGRWSGWSVADPTSQHVEAAQFLDVAFHRVGDHSRC
jgi:hypothetical protein